MLTLVYLVALLLRAIPAPAPAPHYPIAPACDLAGEGCRHAPPPGKRTGAD